MKRLLLLLLICILFSCNQQTVLYGSGTLATIEYPLTDTISDLHIEVDNRNIKIIKDIVSKVVFTIDDNLLESYSFDHDSLLKNLYISKSAKQELVYKDLQIIIYTPLSPEKITIKNCSLFVDTNLSKTKQITVNKDSFYKGRTSGDSLHLSIQNSGRIDIEGSNQVQKVELSDGAAYSFTNSLLYEAWIYMNNNATCSLSVEKYIRGSLGENCTLNIQGGPLVEVEKNLTAKINYFQK